MKRGEEPYMIRFTSYKEYKKLVLKLLNIIEKDDAFTFDDVLNETMEILRVKVKSKEKGEIS